MPFALACTVSYTRSAFRISVFLPSGGEHIVIYGAPWVWAGGPGGGVGGIAPPLNLVGAGKNLAWAVGVGGGVGEIVPSLVGNTSFAWAGGGNGAWFRH